MSRLLLASNRLPVRIVSTSRGPRCEESVGGLATALRDLHARWGGLWVGWPGESSALHADQRERIDAELAGMRLVSVHLSELEVEQFYEAYANGVLWPVFHYLTGVPPLHIEGRSEYEDVNERYAETLARCHETGDVVWVHDYHLMLVPALLRRRIPEARIGFFLHTPFPDAELFATLPGRERLLEGLLGADVLGFHTHSYRRHFEETLRRLLNLDVVGNEVLVGGRVVKLGVFPIGTDAAAVAAAAERPEVEAALAEVHGEWSHRLLVGIDRLDYTKGIPRRLLAFEELLRRRPEWREQVRLIQVGVPTRDGVGAYRRFRAEVDALVARINDTFATPSWTPVEYLPRSLSGQELLALYLAADLMLVTPVRDGMNLVAKEFVASRFDGDGILVLSEFAGAAAELTEAVMVNPYDIELSAETYHQALTMPVDERRARMLALRRQVFEHDVHRWSASFLEALGAPRPGP